MDRLISKIVGSFCFTFRRPNSGAMNTNFTGQPPVQTMQLNTTQRYRIPRGYFAKVGSSTHVHVNQNVLDPQVVGGQVVQEEDAGTLPAPGENVVRLPPEYREAWSQGSP